MEVANMVFPGHYRRWTILWILLVIFLCCVGAKDRDFRLVTREELQPSMDIFIQKNVKSYGQLLFDTIRYQLIVGSRDYLFRLSLEGLKKLEEAHWPADEESVETCHLKGKSRDECRNYIKVLVSNNGKIFSCGTNAFAPECTWREINSLRTITQRVDGVAKCPYNPYTNTTALMTLQGDYYVASTFDFSGQDPAIYRMAKNHSIMGKEPFLRTVRFDPKWLNEAEFIASYEIEDFTYFFFRETAVEYINCGKAVYSRVARICKNDQGGQYLLKDSWTTFLKARLNCSIPGNYPFYYNEIQSIHFLEREQLLYATFTTPANSIFGSAICVFNISSVHRAFNGPFKYQSNPKSAWEKQTTSHKHFQCETPVNDQHFLDSEKYQLMDDAVLPITNYPLYKVDLERFSHIVVDVVATKAHEGVHVMFVATVEGVILKLIVVPETQKTCLIEELQVFSTGSKETIKVLKLLRDTSSLYIGTEESILRIPVNRCNRFKSKNECLSAMDPYCGWNEYQLSCTTAPNRNPSSTIWLQEPTKCPETNRSVDGGWSSWSKWYECIQTGEDASGDRCQCQQRLCNNPSPSNGGSDCKGTSSHITNCTRNGQWTEWSAWSSCSKTCGLSVKTRRRSCGNPSPAYGGHICIGPEQDEIYCTSNPPCPGKTEDQLQVPRVPPVNGQWSDWSTWEECTAPCGGGIQVRRRRCNSPPPQYGGKECLGCSNDHKFCNKHSCPEVRKSTSWTPFLIVNKTRDGYFEQRFRFSCRANVADESMLKMGHMKKEERFCLEGNQNCLDAAFVNIDGEWSAWSLWSECSASCGGGVQFRERACDSPRAAGSGSECQGLSRMDRICNTETCPDLNAWDEWSVWSLCDQQQEQHRRRKCNMPITSESYCKGPSKETRMCIPGQTGLLPSSEGRTAEDGIHAQHVVGAFICGLIAGGLLSACGIYFYIKRKNKKKQGPVATQLIPVKPNTYVDENEWKNNFAVSKGSPQKIPLREATIKRNGNFRAQLQSDHNF